MSRQGKRRAVGHNRWNVVEKMIKEESDCVGKRMMKICQTALCFSLFCPPLAPHERAEKQIECLRRENMQSSLFQLLQKQHRRCNEAERWEGHFSTTVGQTRLTTAQPTSAPRHLSKSSRRLWLLWAVFLRSFTDSYFSIATVHRQQAKGSISVILMAHCIPLTILF